MKIYAVFPLIQREAIDKHCFGDCGKILVGEMDCGDWGMAFPCKEEICPHLEKQLDTSIGESDGCPVYPRKIKD